MDKEKVVDYAQYPYELPIFTGLYVMRYMLRPPLKLELGEDIDDLFQKAVEEVVQSGRSSPSLLQRRLSIGYARAVRLMDQLEAAGVIGPAVGSNSREVLIRSAVPTKPPGSGTSPQDRQYESSPVMQELYEV